MLDTLNTALGALSALAALAQLALEVHGARKAKGMKDDKR